MDRAKTDKSDIDSLWEMSDSKALDVKFISFLCLKEIQEMRTTRVKSKGCVYFIYLFTFYKSI